MTRSLSQVAIQRLYRELDRAEGTQGERLRLGLFLVLHGMAMKNATQPSAHSVTQMPGKTRAKREGGPETHRGAGGWGIGFGVHSRRPAFGLSAIAASTVLDRPA